MEQILPNISRLTLSTNTTDPNTNSDMLEVFPPWGAFPAEQYLLHHWEPSEQNQNQHRRLINDFIHALDDIPEEWIRPSPTSEIMAITPSASQIREILAPWRPLQWRSVAWEIWNQIRCPKWDDEGLNIWLRTHYAEEAEETARDNIKLVEWFKSSFEGNPYMDPDTVDTMMRWQILDDESVFNFKSAWERVFEIIPELTGPKSGLSRRFMPRTDGWGQNYPREEVASLPRLEDRVMAVECSDNCVQYSAVHSYLLVADEKTFTTDELLILYLDRKGNYVRESRIQLPADDLYTRGDMINNGKIRDAQYWTEDSPPGSSLNPKYRALGEIGRELYGVEDLLRT
ncbi:hypothetical protein BGW36DRAFT_381163 [Talaromyces proteolyticus]|uniref:Uncharacterized protein n=1 Tax=Talaromyces proteolyticus TaxID=1131652 RepID=A0AAD4Q043_9EURO|nr:uncharacterized protein BGW36DRAFT_381163 [Talaromyces proteolyticus]KAH8696518.1 hypothetical protein BGW36DRAFT_381163 [Talaromyces proteolyticus]